jgi:hypothetical protein
MKAICGFIDVNHDALSGMLSSLTAADPSDVCSARGKAAQAPAGDSLHVQHTFV